MDSENNEQAQPEEPQQTETPEPQEQEQPEPQEPQEETGEEAEAKADDAESEPEEDDGEEETKPGEGKHRRKTGSQRNRERLEREREQWAQERAFYQTQLAQRTPPQQPGAEAPKATPEQQLQEYLGTMVQQGVHQALALKEQEQAAQQLEQKWQEQLPPDEDESHEVRTFIRNARTGLRPGPVKEALLTSEYAPKIIATLIRNPRELARLSALPEGQAAREIGRLEAQFAAGAAPAKHKPVTRPPPPPTTVGGSAKSTRDAVDLPISEYKRRFRSGR